MTSRKSSRWNWRRRGPEAAVGLLLALGRASSAGELPTAEQELYLAVTLNGVPREAPARFVQMPGGGLAASAATLREIGLRWPGSEEATGLLLLADWPQLRAVFNARLQQVQLRAPVSMLAAAPQRLSARPGWGAPAEISATPPGVLFSYDLFGQRSGGFSTLNGYGEVRAFGLDPGFWSQTFAARAGDGLQDGRALTRLDSHWQRHWPHEMLTLTVGDTVTGGLSWARSVRLGGVRLARDFGLQPYRVTAPLAAFQGEAVLPSTVELYVQGLRQSVQQVAPGPFEIENLPWLSGAGRAEVRITDINGQRRTLDFDFYGAQGLLQGGLWDGSVEAGFVRRAYGLRSDAYEGAPVFNAVGRYGWSETLTLEGQLQAGRGLRLAGAGAVWRLPGLAGVANASLAGSRSDGGTGHQWTAGWQWSAHPWHLSLGTQRRSSGWNDIASRFDSLPVRSIDHLFAGFSSRWGEWGASLVRQRMDDGSRQQYGSLSWSHQLPGRSMLHLSLLHGSGGGSAGDIDTTLQARWYLPLGDRRAVSLAARHQDGRSTWLAEASQAAPGGGEPAWGWRVLAESGDFDGRAQAQLHRLAQAMEWNLGVVGSRRGDTLLYGGANGSFSWMGGTLRPMRRADEGYALVSTAGVAGVPVRLENRLVGHTDEDGFLLVPQLNAYQRNRISIDTQELALELRLDRNLQEAVPARRSGTLVHFDLRRVAAVQLVLRGPDGQPLPAGSTVRVDPPLPRPGTTVVGYDGLVYLESPEQGARLQVQTAGGTCLLTLPPVRPGWNDLGAVACAWKEG